MISFILLSYGSLAYERKQWKHWIDADKDCQNTRAEILIVSSQIPVVFKTDRQCLVVSGRWVLLYDGGFETRASKIDIDHIIPLKWMDVHGGADWSSAKKMQFANDADNLLAVSARANRSKGAKGIDEWLPDNYQCKYGRHWQYLGKKYQIAFSVEVRSIIAKIIESYC